MAQSVKAGKPSSSANVFIPAAVLSLVVCMAAIVMLMWWHHKSGRGSVFLHPGTAQAAQLLVRTTFADVTQVGEPAITGDRLVTLTATIAQKECKVKLHSALELENDYGWTIKHMECPPPA